ncbi:mevalonate kinase/galactokinase [Holotrichia oblita]|nr:mevalonate kinase/galactokinase [Holotrichia oblita]
MMNREDLIIRFANVYGSSDDTQFFFSPGRVNLIGEHTDYNGGYVFPCAIDIGTTGIARKTDGKVMKFASTAFNGVVEEKLDDISYKNENGWANHMIGVVNEFILRGFDIGGFEILIDGSIPNASGLSSSASIELLTCVVLKEMFNCDIEMLDMVKLSQHSENQFCGVNCGIMDQFAVGMGKKNHAMLLDCASLKYEYVPVVLNGCKLVIGNTNKRRELADSKYNERRAECEEAVRLLAKKFNISLLSEISPEDFEENKGLIENETIRKRAEHVVYEIMRTKQAVDKLKANDITSFGQLMNQSHESLRDLYEVTGFELDTMVTEAWKIDGVIGSRMTGAGFGGCTISIVRDDAVEDFISSVGTNYELATGLKANFYIAGIGNGASVG